MPLQRDKSPRLKRILALLSLACVAGFAGCGKDPGSHPAPAGDSGRTVHFSCREHPRVVSGEKGSCSVCKLELTRQKSVGTFLCVDHFESASVVPAGCTVCDKLLVAVPEGKIWKCTRHPEVVVDDPGGCPVCDLELVEVLVGLVGLVVELHSLDQPPPHGGCGFASGCPAPVFFRQLYPADGSGCFQGKVPACQA